jgi:hypothetical protein
MQPIGAVRDEVIDALVRLKGPAAVKAVPAEVLATLVRVWQELVPATIGEPPFEHSDGRPRLTSSVVAFFDELGAKERIKQLSDAGLAQWIRASRDTMGWFDEEGKHEAVVGFSDNVGTATPVWLGACGNVPTDVTDQVRQTLDSLGGVQFTHFIEREMLYRGGVAFGPVWAEPGRIYGQALVDAVTLESRHAMFPRIVVDETCRNLVAASDVLDGSGDSEQLLVDEHGEAFVNYLLAGIQLAVEDGYGADELLARHREAVEKRLRAANRADVSEKLSWVGRYHNWVCDRIDLAGHRVHQGLLVADSERHEFKRLGAVLNFP